MSSVRHRHGLRGVTCAVAFGVALAAGCGGSSAGSSAGPSHTPASSRAPASSAAAAVPLLVPCYADVGRCVVTPGEHELPAESVLPGLRLTIPAGWTGAENDAGELHLKPPMRPDDALLVWHGIAAVQSTGPERGKVLPTVGRSADALLHWVQTNPDFTVVGVPRSATVGDISGTLLTVEVSRTARFGDPECPSNPHCAAFFTDPDHWNGNFFAIGAPETAQLLFATIRQSGRDSTLVVALDAPSPAALRKLRQAAQPLLASLHLPPGLSSV